MWSKTILSDPDIRDMHGLDDLTYIKDNIDSIYRNIKIDHIMDIDRFTIIPEKFDLFKESDSFEVIEKYLKGYVISGSLSLGLFFDNFPLRESDIDIIISDSDSQSNLVSDISKEGAYMDENYIGYKYYTIPSTDRFLKKKRHKKVDFFVSSPKYIDHCGLKIHHPIELIGIKVDLVKNGGSDKTINKHLYDIKHIMKYFT